MKDKFNKFFKKFLDIFLTALVSAILAILTEWLKNKTGAEIPNIDPAETAGIGGAIAGIKNTKFNIKLF